MICSIAICSCSSRIVCFATSFMQCSISVLPICFMRLMCGPNFWISVLFIASNTSYLWSCVHQSNDLWIYSKGYTLSMSECCRIVGRLDGFWLAGFQNAMIPPLASLIGLHGFLWAEAPPRSRQITCILSPSMMPMSASWNCGLRGLCLAIRQKSFASVSISTCRWSSQALACSGMCVMRVRSPSLMRSCAFFVALGSEISELKMRSLGFGPSGVVSCHWLFLWGLGDVKLIQNANKSKRNQAITKGSSRARRLCAVPRGV